MDDLALLDSLDLGVVRIAPDWTVTDWSAAATRITGTPRELVVGRNFWHRFPTAKGTFVEQVCQSVLADGKPRSYIWPSRAPELAGMVFETSVMREPSPAAAGGLVMVFRQVRSEIPPESYAAQVLSAFETERRLYRQLFTSHPSASLILSTDGQILEANPAASALLRASDPRELAGRSLADWVAPADRDRLASAMAAALDTPQRLRLALEMDGDWIADLDAVITNVDPGFPGPAKLAFLALDESQEALLQRKLLQADRLAQLGGLVSGVAHELNNPLAAISAFAELLTVDSASAAQRESSAIIHAEAMRAGRMVQTLLDFARQRPRTRQAVDPQEVVERVLSLQRSALKRARIKTQVRIADDVPTVMGDPQELQQVVLNAVVNSLQAIESTRQSGRLIVAARRADHFVMLTIEDDGPGVPPEILDRVFDPFFTTKGEQGTGLGLAISLGLVKGMGGRMWIQNLESGGARLSIELPSETGQPAEERRGGFQPAGRPLKVIVVEDEPTVRQAMTLMAERLGHTVKSVAGYEDARRLLLERRTACDAVLVDVHLDEDYTGFDLFDGLRREGEGRERRLVFTTGDSVSSDTRDRLQSSERPVLRKPFSLEELREVLDRVAP